LFQGKDKSLDIRYLREALELARRAKGRTSPNPSVGAVVVKDGIVVGRGATQVAGGDHAEVVAIREAGDAVMESDLYVTLEPCCFHGRTPPCSDLIIEKKVKRVMIGALDVNPKVSGKGMAELESAGIEVSCGHLEEEITELNEDYAKFIQRKVPFVIAKYAMTLDGKIASYTGDSKWISGDMSREMAHRIRNQVDAIMVGVNTVIRDNPQLNVRLNEKHKDPVRIVLDSHGRTPVDSNLVQDGLRTIIVMKKTDQNSHEKARLIKTCAERGVEIIYDDSEGLGVSLTKLMSILAERNITSILLEGGGELLASALREEIIDKIICFIAPKIILGRDAIFPFGGLGLEKISDAYELKRIKLDQVDDDVLITGYVRYDKKQNK